MAKRTFVNDDPSQGIDGTLIDADWLNAINNHRHSGLNVDGAGALDYAAETGAANAYVITLSPALSAHIVGMPIIFKATNANTGASTLNVNALGAVAIRKFGSTVLAAGDIAAGQLVVVAYDGTYYQLLSGGYSFTASLGTSGYQKFPSGLILQWGAVSSTDTGSYAITFPTTFASACYGAWAIDRATGYAGVSMISSGTPSTTGVTFYGANDAGGAAEMVFYWWAIGR